MGGVAHVPFDEAVEREADLVVGLDQVLAREHVSRLAIPGGEELEPLTDEGATVGLRVAAGASTRRPGCFG